MSDILIRVENVSKKFSSDLKTSLWHGVKDILSEVSGRRASSDLRPGEFWSVKDLSFDLKRGECLGLIGPNGAGKSTLLKMLSGLIKPNRGRISVRGRVGALVELGAGFNPILTGRENIYVNGAVLGFNKDVINRKFDEIVEFSEIGEFIDMPVQNYSSGMKVRLGFAVASCIEPDVLLLDEVLAVGDVGFRSKCFNAIDKIASRSAVIFVSHVMPQVARICSDVIVLNRGTAFYQGSDVAKGIDIFYSHFQTEKGSVSGSGNAEILSTRITSNGRQDKPGERFVVDYLSNLSIELDIKADRRYPKLNINIAFYDKELRGAAQIYSANSDFKVVNDGEIVSVRTTIRNFILNPGIYTLSIIITDERRGTTLANYHWIKEIQVVGPFIGFASVQFRGEWEKLS